jgi:hypothetical protein
MTYPKGRYSFDISSGSFMYHAPEPLDRASRRPERTAKTRDCSAGRAPEKVLSPGGRAVIRSSMAALGE